MASVHPGKSLRRTRCVVWLCYSILGPRPLGWCRKRLDLCPRRRSIWCAQHPEDERWRSRGWTNLDGYGQPCTHRIAVHHGAWTFEHGCDCRHACRTIRLKIWEGSFGLSQTLTLYLQIHAINFANSPSIFSFATRHRKFAKFHAQLGRNFTADSKATARHKLSFLPIAP